MVAATKNRKALVRKIELHLRHYRQYKVAIKNLQKQLDYIMPAMTASYELREGSMGAFIISSSTDKCAIDRIESKRALDIHEQIRRYTMLVDSIDEALKELPDHEQKFLKHRYFQDWSIHKTALSLGYSEQHVFRVRNDVMEKLLITLRGIIEYL